MTEKRSLLLSQCYTDTTGLRFHSYRQKELPLVHLPFTAYPTTKHELWPELQAWECWRQWCFSSTAIFYGHVVSCEEGKACFSKCHQVYLLTWSGFRKYWQMFIFMTDLCANSWKTNSLSRLAAAFLHSDISSFLHHRSLFWGSQGILIGSQIPVPVLHTVSFQLQRLQICPKLVKRLRTNLSFPLQWCEYSSTWPL